MLQGRRHRSAMIFRAEIFYHQDGREVVDDHAAFEAKDIIAARYMMENGWQREAKCFFPTATFGCSLATMSTTPGNWRIACRR
jgi:hypothetical protein